MPVLLGRIWLATVRSLVCFVDRPNVAGGEALAGLLRAGNAGSNATADHITVLDTALAALSEHARPTPGDDRGTWEGPRVLDRGGWTGWSRRLASTH